MQLNDDEPINEQNTMELSLANLSLGRHLPSERRFALFGTHTINYIHTYVINYTQLSYMYLNTPLQLFESLTQQIG